MINPLDTLSGQTAQNTNLASIYTVIDSTEADTDDNQAK